MWLIFEDFDWTFSSLLSSSPSLSEESLELPESDEEEEEEDEDDEEEDLDLGGLGSAMIGLVTLELVVGLGDDVAVSGFLTSLGLFS